MAEASGQQQPSDSPRAPLFYRESQLLTAQHHGTWRLTGGDFAFASGAIAVPIVTSEFVAVLRNYPIVFATNGEDISPIALLGMENTNLLVTDGRWEEGTYVPAYVRRYPFGFVAHGDSFALTIDAASSRVLRGGTDGVPLFEDGKPTAITQDGLRFCDAFRGEANATQEFCRALKSKALLIDRRATATLPNGQQLGVDGFQVVDTQKFAALDAATVVEWHQNGYMALVHFHLASLDRFEQLVALRSARDAKRQPAG